MPREDNIPPAPDLRWAYFFDIDGTLAEIAAHPRGARVERRVRDLIERLFQESGGAVALMTGRSIEDADRLMHNLAMPVAGQHGLERRTASGEIVRHEFDANAFSTACDEISRRTAAMRGLITEMKGSSIAIHYRGAPERKDAVHEIMDAALASLGDRFTSLNGKMVAELKPAGKDKGIAIAEFLQEAPFAGRIPVFAGDDVTDEDGFKAVNLAAGHSIKVGVGPTSARWRLRTVTAVHDWLSGAFDHEDGIVG